MEDKRDDQGLLTVFTAILDRRARMEEEDVRSSKQPVVAGMEATDSASPAIGQPVPSTDIWVILAEKGGFWGEGSWISIFLVSTNELAPV